MRSATVMAVVVALAFGGLGCATKKYVRQTVAPLDTRVGEVDKKTDANTSSIGQLEVNVSRADERATDADRKAVAAGQDAARANEAAGKAGQQAMDAHSLAEKGMNRTNELEQSFDRKLDNVDNYHMVSNGTVQFAFNKFNLSDDAKEKLDEMAKGVSDMKHYVIEVQGFTDKSGKPDYNLELSRKRADAVVRYLTLKHNIPLRRVQLLGVGAENPVNAANTRKARKENRRVEVKVWATEGTTPRAVASDVRSQ